MTTPPVPLDGTKPVRLVRNAVRCRICGDTLEVTGRHEHQVCSCGNAHLHGGLDHEAHGVDGWDSIEDLCEFADG